MVSLYPSEFYSPCDDVWIVTTYFNPARYEILKYNYLKFIKPIIKFQINIITMECAFGEQPFELHPSERIIQVRSHDIMWIKERLINLAINHLPSTVKKIVWTDCDMLFCNPDWLVRTSALLDRYPLVQPCSSLHRLERGESAYRGRGYFRRSFACQHQRRPESASLWSGAHGFPGGAWAARRSLIDKHKLYDAEILGSNDELFAHAAGGGLNSRCVRGITGARVRPLPNLVVKIINRLLRIPWPSWLATWYLASSKRMPSPAPGERFFSHYLDWAREFSADVRGRIGCVPGMALHLWHGDPVKRQYGSRNAILRRHDFDPASDLSLTAEGLWEWSSDKTGLHRDVEDYFFSRCEDG